jgi:hypothetical protein
MDIYLNKWSSRNYYWLISNAQVKGAILKILKKKKKKKTSEKISSASPKLCKHLSRDTMFT